jgi:hypothetical protein
MQNSGAMIKRKWSTLMTSLFKKPLDTIEFVIDQWQTSGLEFDEKLQTLVVKTYSNQMALHQKVIDHIKQSLLHSSPQQTCPEWLRDIDSFFCSQFAAVNHNSSGMSLWIAYIDVLQLLTPIVMLDHIVKMKSFNDKVIDPGIYFFSTLAIPRDLLEAQRLYAAILECPRSFDYHKNDKPFLSPQAFKAQMLFVLLVSKKTIKDSDFWNFQLECLKTCPDYLLDYPDILKDGYNFEPANRMALDVSDQDFREILSRRASREYTRNLENVTQYEKSRDQASNNLIPDFPPDTQTLDKRVSEEQQELAGLLLELDSYLEQHFHPIYKSLLPGVNDEQIDKFNQIVHPLKLPEDLATLYKWHNGTKQDGFLFDDPEMLSIEYALMQYRRDVEMGEEYCWCAAWFILGYASRLYWLVPMSEATCQEAPILSHMIEDGGVVMIHSSIKNMIRSYLEVYKKNLATLDDSGCFWSIDMDRFDKISLKYSPEIVSAKTYDAWYTADWPKEWQKYSIGSVE